LRKIITLILLTLFIASKPCFAQTIDSVRDDLTIAQLPNKYYTSVGKKINSINEHLTKKSLKYLKRFQRQETKIRQKLEKLDPGSVANNADAKYKQLVQKVSSDSPDSLITSTGSE
jgi:cell division protein YceG involved in septum cleavage